MTDLEDKALRHVRLLTALLLVATFALGTVTGLGIARLLGPPPPFGPPPPPPFALAGPLRGLDLSPEQVEEVRRIEERHRPELEAIVRSTFPRVRDVQERIRGEVRSVLTPAQRARLDEIERRSPPRGPGAPGFGPPGPPGFGPPGPPGFGPPAPPPPESP